MRGKFSKVVVLGYNIFIVVNMKFVIDLYEGIIGC